MNMKKATLIVWIIAGLLVSFLIGLTTGEKTGRRAIILQVADKVSYCYESGASGYYTTDKGVRCLYD